MPHAYNGILKQYGIMYIMTCMVPAVWDHVFRYVSWNLYVVLNEFVKSKQEPSVVEQLIFPGTLESFKYSYVTYLVYIALWQFG
jgi:hypothetical protein